MLINSIQTVLKDANNCWKYLEQKLSAISNPWRTLLCSVDFFNKKQTDKASPQHPCSPKTFGHAIKKATIIISSNQKSKIYQPVNILVIIKDSSFNITQLLFISILNYKFKSNSRLFFPGSCLWIPRATLCQSRDQRLKATITNPILWAIVAL